MFGEILGAVSSLAGGLFGKSQADKQAKLQKQFAKKGIQWKVEDAKKAGIHPLYALGANTTSYQPVSVGGGLESALPSMGQNIGRAIDGQLNEGGKVEAIALAGQALQNEGLRLDNEIKKAELASRLAVMRQAGSPPGTVGARPTLDGQGNSIPGIRIQKTMSPSEAGLPHFEAGLGQDVSWIKTKHGWTKVIPQPLQEALENDVIGRWQWQARNRVADMILANDPPYAAGPGEYWMTMPFTGDYRKRKYERRTGELFGYPFELQWKGW